MNVNFGSVRSIAVNQHGSGKVDKDNLLARPQRCGSIELSTVTSPNVKVTLRFEIEREGTFHALAAWST